MVSALRKLLLPALPSEPLRWVQAEDLWHEARILIGELAERAQARHRLHSERLAHALTESGATLLATQQVAALTGAVAHQLPRLGIPGAWMGLFEPLPAPVPDCRTSRVAAAAGAHDPSGARLRRRARAARDAGARNHDRRGRFSPGRIDRDRSGADAPIIVEPLFFHDRPLGCLLMEMGPREGIVYESLAEQVSSALEGARLVSRLVEEATRRQVAERERLEKEMEIAARIQTSILPARHDRRRAGDRRRHAAATEVGGDYYDVVPVEDGCWIGIGDVAGHGLGTGLVMLMMQSGIGALARKMPNASPRDLLLAVNTMLVENVRVRLGQHEHATLTVLRYRRDGSLDVRGRARGDPHPARGDRPLRAHRNARALGRRQTRHRRRHRRQQRQAGARRSDGALHRRRHRSRRPATEAATASESNAWSPSSRSTAR